MSLVDCLLMTLFNAAICITLPKGISLLQQQGKKTTVLRPEFIESSKVPSIS